jgi:hypothetical protein
MFLSFACVSLAGVAKFPLLALTMKIDHPIRLRR